MKPVWITGKVAGHDVAAGLDAEGDAFGSPVILDWVRRAVAADRYVTPPFPWPKVKASMSEPLGFACAMLELCDVDTVTFVSGRDQVPFQVPADLIV